MTGVLLDVLIVVLALLAAIASFSWLHRRDFRRRP